MKTAYLAVNGNDETAALDDRTRPFKTRKAAWEALAPFRQDHAVDVVDLGYVKP